ncbi:MAG: flagellar basal body-associated protein FliL [Alphaproteobacteria bacterium]
MANEATPKTKSRLVVAAVIATVVVGAGGAAGAWALKLVGGDEHEAARPSSGDGDARRAAEGGGEREPARDPAAEPIFVDLPPLVVNLVSEGAGTHFLKLALAVEVDDPDTADRIEEMAPRIVDSFQLYLRSLTPDELSGPGAMFRLKEDLHVRIHEAIAPAEVRDVLFKEMLVQ